MGFDVGGIALTSPGTTLSLDSGATNWMKVNVSGILTRPQTPYFRGQIIGGGAPYNPGAVPLKVTANVNIGNCWNSSTGLFTCPVAGYYMVTGGGIMGGMASYGYLYIYKNGGSQGFTHWNHQGSWHYVNLSCIVLCAIGDTISYLIQSTSPANAGIYGESGHQMFSIALMA